MVVRQSIDTLQFTDAFVFGFSGRMIAQYAKSGTGGNKHLHKLAVDLKPVLDRINVAIGRVQKQLPLSNREDFTKLLTEVGTACNAHRRGPLVTHWTCLGMAVAGLFDLIGDRVDIGTEVDLDGKKLGKQSDEIRELAGRAGVAIDVSRIVKNHLDRLADEVRGNFDLGPAMNCCQSIRQLLLDAAAELDRLSQGTLDESALDKLQVLRPEQSVQEAIVTLLRRSDESGLSAQTIQEHLKQLNVDISDDTVRVHCHKLFSDGKILHNGKENRGSRWIHPRFRESGD